jgi:hypothetical protein
LERQVYVPVPPDSDMAKICSLLEKGKEQFRHCIRSVGNSIRRVLDSEAVREDSMMGSLSRFDLSKLDGNQIRQNIFGKEQPYRGFFKIVPKRLWPWVGFESLRGFEVQYWNDVVQMRVAERRDVSNFQIS